MHHGILYQVCEYHREYQSFISASDFIFIFFVFGSVEHKKKKII